ncbi:MAG TPA: glucose-6-phosphate dehydrogenase [Acidimicrobiales bacterium]|nr:glucose-6-phosphate dehydrogenase [Acidimicrobiales bacterium]
MLVVFGASGDLTSRKLLPAVERLASRRLLPTAFSVVGVARTQWTDEDFRAHALEAVKDRSGPEWTSLVNGFRYVAGDYAEADTFERLRAVLDEIDASLGTGGNRVFYFATVPNVFGMLASALAEHGLARRREDGPHAFVRVVVEKPFGRDLPSAQALDRELHSVFDESQLYRIDHYLGKETVQNVLALRFANAIFEPVWNRRYVESVQITVAESVGVGHRGAFYESAGALRDIVQNHVMQVLALTAMEPPATVDAKGIRDEKVKVLRAVQVVETRRGQYDAGWVEGEEVLAYRSEEGISPTSTTETYVAARLSVDNWRWAGVPFFLRTGKRLPKRLTEVALVFRGVPHLPFPPGMASGLGPNAMVLRIQPDEGITLRFGAKVPGQAFRVRTVNMDFSYGAAFVEESPEAYERLLLDAMSGDPTLFIRTDEVEQAWTIWDPVVSAWAAGGAGGLERYAAGSWGPSAADALLGEGRSWRSP